MDDELLRINPGPRKKGLFFHYFWQHTRRRTMAIREWSLQAQYIEFAAATKEAIL